LVCRSRLIVWIPMLTVRNFSYTYEGQDQPALSGISLTVGPGECVCLTGHSGCGKSTLLLSLKRLLQGGASSGEICWHGRCRAGEEVLAGIGLVFQNAESQILCATSFDEVAFGPENLCMPVTEITARVADALAAVRLLEFGNRNVERFSAGQKQRLSIASIFSMGPECILLDEPTSQLDRGGKEDLRAILHHLKSRGIAIMIAEHNIEPFVGLVDRYYAMSGGRIEAVLDEPPRGTSVGRGKGGSPRPVPVPGQVVPSISAEGLGISYAGTGPVLHDIAFSVLQGELVHIYGENGCGKSTLLKALAGALQVDSGRLLLAGKDISAKTSTLGDVALLFQNPQRQLFEDTVYDEVAFTLKRLKLPPDEVEARVTAALELCEASHLAMRLPLTLSYGEQHRVALASVIAPEPAILLLDEPFAGLDPAQRLRLLNILSSLRAERGSTIVIASHDPLPDPDWADRVICMEAGRIVDLNRMSQ